MYIVTGGAGLIGSAFIWRLNQEGITDIMVVDHLGCGEKWKNLRALRFSDYLEKDVFLERLLNRSLYCGPIEAIVHLGACSSTVERDATYLVGNNFEYSKKLCDFAVEHRTRFMYASSCATYGDGRRGYADNEAELEKLRPLNMYGYSKHMFDLWLKRHGRLDRVTGLKFSNIYGPNELHKGEMRSVVCRAYEQISADGKMRLFKSYRPEYKDGEQQRDFLYVKDAADMMMFLLNTGKGMGIYNIGSGWAETWNDLALAAFDALQVKPDIEYIDMPEPLRDRYQYYTKAEMTKLRNLGYDKEPASLHDAVADYIRNYRLPDKFLGDE